MQSIHLNLIYQPYFFRVSNATISVANVENAHHSTRYFNILSVLKNALKQVIGSNYTEEYSWHKESARNSERARFNIE